jgi:hypothetical protein
MKFGLAYRALAFLFVFFPWKIFAQGVHSPGEIHQVLKKGRPVEGLISSDQRYTQDSAQGDLLGLSLALPKEMEQEANIYLLKNGKWAFHWTFSSDQHLGLSMVLHVGPDFLVKNATFDSYWLNEASIGYAEQAIEQGDWFLKPIWGSHFHLWIVLDSVENLSVKGLQFIKAYQLAQGSERDRSPIGFDKSFECHRNINCPEGEPYQNVKKGVCKILMPLEEGLAFCSGSLINNTSTQAIPYVLTAYHCDNGYTPFYHLYEFIFEYEAEGCPNPSIEPIHKSLRGAEKIAGYQGTDAGLFRITASIPSHFDLYLNGWTRDTTYGEAVALIHHPMGDIKKISVQNQGIFVHPNPINWSAGYQSQPYTHLRATFDAGTQQPGSSGSSLFNAQGHILGQLHGGLSSCVNLRAFIGRFNLSWDQGESPQTRLSDWLDPEGLNPMSLEGRPYSNVRHFDLYITDALGNPFTDSVAVVYGFPPQPAMKENHYFRVSLEPGVGTTLRISVPGITSQGIEGGDLNEMRWILQQKKQMNEPEQWASDVNMDGLVDFEDLEELKKVFLLKDYAFTSGRVWRFTESLFFIAPEEPGKRLDVQAVKLGDINFSLLGGE